MDRCPTLRPLKSQICNGILWHVLKTCSQSRVAPSTTVSDVVSVILYKIHNDPPPTIVKFSFGSRFPLKKKLIGLAHPMIFPSPPPPHPDQINNDRSLKVVAVAYERLSLTRGSQCTDLPKKRLVFWKTGRRGEVVAYERWSQPEARLYQLVCVCLSYQRQSFSKSLNMIFSVLILIKEFTQRFHGTYCRNRLAEGFWFTLIPRLSVQWLIKKVARQICLLRRHKMTPNSNVFYRSSRLGRHYSRPLIRSDSHIEIWFDALPKND